MNTDAHYSGFHKGPVSPSPPMVNDGSWPVAAWPVAEKQKPAPPCWVMAGGRKRYTGLWGGPEESKPSLTRRIVEFQIAEITVVYERYSTWLGLDFH